jgi:hypothetical protein
MKKAQRTTETPGLARVRAGALTLSPVAGPDPTPWQPVYGPDPTPWIVVIGNPIRH